jgi:small acid-soluble spore protein (thioredoxin-like protein)
MKHNPDDRRDNVEKIQFNINKTIQNIEMAEEMIDKCDNEDTKKSLIEKNNKRKEALEAMRHEIKDEAIDREHGYKS